MNFSQFRRSLLTFSCSFLILTQIFAQEVRDNFISGLNNVNEKNNFSIDVKDNFSSGTIYDIKKDSKDRIWLATNKGIYVSDGMNFIQIIIGDVNVTNSAIKELIVEGENMFLLFQDKGLVKLNVNSLSYTKITDKPVSSLIIEKNHNAILVTKESEFYTFEYTDKKRVVLHKVLSLVNDDDYEPIMSNLSDDYLIVSLVNKGLYKINKHTWKIEKKYNLIPNGFNNSFTHLNNRLFFINHSVLYELNKEEQFTISNYVKNNQNLSFVLPIDAFNKIIIRSKKNLFLESNGIEIQFNLQKTKNYEVNNALYISKDNIIFGSNQGLLKVYNIEHKVSSIYDSVIQMKEYVNVRRKIIPYNENEVIFLGFPKSHIYNFKTGNYKAISEKINPLFDAVLIENNLYATSEGGGVKKIDLSSKRFSNIITKHIDTTRYYGAIADIGYLLKDHIIVGRRGEFILYNYKNNISKSFSLKNVGAKINSIIVDSTSALIYLATNEGLYYFNLNKNLIVKKTHIKGTIISDLAIMRKNGQSSLWYISDQGLTGLSLDNNKILVHLDLKNFNDARLTAIIIDENKKIWISSYNGIYAYDYPIDNVITVNNRNGLVNQEFNFKAAAKLHNGQLIFGGLNGYDIVNSVLFNFTGKQLKGSILGYSIYGLNKVEYHHFNSKEIVQYNTDNYYIELYFSIKNFQKFKETEFEFRIDNAAWLPLKGYSYLYMYNLKDGIHTIDIRGWDDSGNPIVFDSVKVNQQTDFIKSTNFRYLLFFIFIILMLITGFVYYYNKRELDNIKVNIAMDLHDEIGSILNRSLYTIKDDPFLRKNTQLISYLSEALYGIRTYINAYNADKISLNQFFDEIKEYVSSYFKNSGIQYDLDAKIEEHVNLNSFIYRDLKLIIYEINQNILKHSKATRVNAYFLIKNGHFYASIMDNGILVSDKEIERKGNGVTNIRKRVERLKGKVVFSINPKGYGLKIEIRLNLA